MKNAAAMLHMKLTTVVKFTVLSAVFSAFFPSHVLSGVCFAPDCREQFILEGMDNVNSDSRYCEENGYVTSCPAGTVQIASSECYRDPAYFKCSAEQWCKLNGYQVSSCSVPQYPYEQCPNGQPLYKSCQTDNARACKELNGAYANSCPYGQKLQNGVYCPYDSSFGICCTPAGCPAYSSLTPSSFGSNGTDGCGYTCYYTCDPQCPAGTSETDPGGCGTPTTNGCKNKTCYPPYQSCCSFTTTEAFCNSQCKYTSKNFCSRNGNTYYEGCGDSKCFANEKCDSLGKCINLGKYSGWCCGYEMRCGYLGVTSHENDNDCRRDYSGRTCYQQCSSFLGYPNCPDLIQECRNNGGTASFLHCSSSSSPSGRNRSYFICQ